MLPEGLAPELNQRRAEHHRLIRQVNEQVAALDALEQGWAEADREYEAALVAAHREGRMPPKDSRPSKADREAQRASFVASCWAACRVLSEFIAGTVELARQHEAELLADLQAGLPAIQQKHERASGRSRRRGPPSGS